MRPIRTARSTLTGPRRVVDKIAIKPANSAFSIETERAKPRDTSARASNTPKQGEASSRTRTENAVGIPEDRRRRKTTDTRNSAQSEIGTGGDRQRIVTFRTRISEYRAVETGRDRPGIVATLRGRNRGPVPSEGNGPVSSRLKAASHD